MELDLTDGQGSPGEGTFGSTTTVRFTCSRPGAASYIDLTAPTVHEVRLNGADLDVAAVFELMGEH